MPFSTYGRLAVGLGGLVALLFTLPTGVYLSGPALAQEAGGTPPADDAGKPDDDETKTEPGRLFPRIELDLENHRLTIEGKIALQEGLLEFLAVAAYGKTHESICALDVDAKNFKAALLLLGLEEKPQVEHLGEAKALKGDKVNIWLEWDEGEKAVRHLAEKLILNQRSQETMRPVGWVFTGSRFIKQAVFVEGRDEPVEKEFFMADETGSLVATYHNPDSILDNPLESGGDDTIWYANKKLLPPRGTPIRFIVEVRTPKKAKAPADGKKKDGAGRKPAEKDGH